MFRRCLFGTVRPVFRFISPVLDIIPASSFQLVNSKFNMAFYHTNGYTNGLPSNHNHVVNTSRGQIQVIYGPMFSGKTTELIRRLKRYTFAQYRCLIIKYANDTRYSEVSVATHDGQSLPATSCTLLNQTKSMLDNFDVIGIDEGQFFPDVISFSEEVANAGKIVIVAALDGDFQRSEFGKILQLVPLAESVVKLNAVCMSCFHDASFTKRISNEQEVEIIGGADKYMSVCRECHRLSKPIKNSPCKMEVTPIQLQMNHKPNFNI